MGPSLSTLAIGTHQRMDTDPVIDLTAQDYQEYGEIMHGLIAIFQIARGSGVLKILVSPRPQPMRLDAILRSCCVSVMVPC